MADIDLATLTNGVTADDGTGVFDLLIQSVERHIQDQYDCDRIKGTDFAEVYLGSMQSVLSEAIKFLLTEQQADKQADLIAEQIKSEIKNNEDGGVIDLQKQKLQEEIDLVVAQTAAAYEQVQASQQDTVRKNLLNTKMALKTDAETVNVGANTTLTYSQNAEELAGTIRKDAESALQISESTLNGIENRLKTQEEVDVLAAREAEELAATIRQDLESTQKIALMTAQTLGFKTDTKQKILKQMLEGYAVNLSIAGVGNVPETCQDASIDQLSQEILDDLSSLVVIQTPDQTPAAGEVVPPPL